MTLRVIDLDRRQVAIEVIRHAVEAVLLVDVRDAVDVVRVLHVSGGMDHPLRVDDHGDHDRRASRLHSIAAPLEPTGFSGHVRVEERDERCGDSVEHCVAGLPGSERLCLKHELHPGEPLRPLRLRARTGSAYDGDRRQPVESLAAKRLEAGRDERHAVPNHDADRAHLRQFDGLGL